MCISAYLYRGCYYYSCKYFYYIFFKTIIVTYFHHHLGSFLQRYLGHTPPPPRLKLSMWKKWIMWIGGGALGPGGWDGVGLEWALFLCVAKFLNILMCCGTVVFVLFFLRNLFSLGSALNMFVYSSVFVAPSRVYLVK